MKTSRLWIAGACIALVPSCAVPRDSEERVEERVSDLAGWFLSGPAQQSYRLSADHAVKRAGRASGRLELVGEDPGGAGVLMQSIPADAYRGKRLRFSASARTAGVERWSGLWMKVDCSVGRAQFDNMQDRPLGGTMDWERHAVVLDVPEDAVAIHFGLLQDGPGVSWIDEASLEVVGLDVPATDLDRRPLALADAGFEAGEGVLSPWMITGVARDDFRVERSDEVVRGGRTSLKLSHAVEHPRGFAAVEQSIRADAYRGKRVRASAWIKGEELASPGGIHVIAFAPDSPPLSPGLESAGFYDSGSFDWRRFEIVIDVPDEADAIVVGIGTKASGTMFIDDVALEEVGLDVPVSKVDGRPSRVANPTLDLGDTTPEGWFISGGARSHYRAVVDRGVHREGSASARFEPIVDEPQGYGTLMQRFKAHAYRGQRLRMTAHVKGQGVDGRGDVWLRVQAVDSPGDGPGLGGGRCVLSGDFDWKPCTIVFDVPTRGDAIDIGVGTTGHGTLWLDDVRLEQVDLTVPLTHERGEPRALQNGGFDDEGAPPRGWFLSGGGRDHFEATVDGGAARLRAKAENGGAADAPLAYGTLMQSIQAAAYKGKRMRMRARVRGDGLAAGDVWLRVQSPTSPGDGPGLGGGSCPLEGTFDFRPCEIVFEVPERGSSIQIGAGIRGDGSGTVWLDDVVLEEVDRGVRVTSEVHDRNEAENLGFEPR